ncbi:MAG: polysaccharide deacetylase family protein [Armatimonadetes bacterium]|nr:polysaccharide deacetylase family protein [Armatimonadota bacterium]
MASAQRPVGLWQQVAQPVAKIRAETKLEMARGVDQSKFMRGDRRKREICLTFDDGPHPGKTERLLQVLRDESVKATFFVVGEMAEKYPHLVRAESLDGHEIGSHTFHHVNMTKVTPSVLRQELTQTDLVLRHILGHGGELLRPPGGQYDSRTIDMARSVGYTTVLWTDDPGDYDPKIGADLILQRLIRDASPGGIILLHDGPETTMAILPRLIRYLRAQGYTFVTCGQLMRNSRP